MLLDDINSASPEQLAETIRRAIEADPATGLYIRATQAARRLSMLAALGNADAKAVAEKIDDEAFEAYTMNFVEDTLSMVSGHDENLMDLLRQYLDQSDPGDETDFDGDEDDFVDEAIIADIDGLDDGDEDDNYLLLKDVKAEVRELSEKFLRDVLAAYADTDTPNMTIEVSIGQGEAIPGVVLEMGSIGYRDDTVE